MDSVNEDEYVNPEPPAKKAKRGTFYFLQVVVAVGIVVATLFTAWTDPGLLPGTFGDKITIASAPEFTEEPEEQFIIPTPRLKPLVGIVVGHWDDNSKDPGAICSDIALTEFEVNQNVSTLVRDMLIAQDIDVDVLREFDPKLDNYQANVLISIHADTCDYINAEATGFKVSSSLANPHPDRAARLSGCLRNRYNQATGLRHHNSITIDMTSYHAFDEINDGTTAAIVEVGFLNLDRVLLTQHPDLVAKGITDGILCYLNNESINSDPPPQSTP